jgi:ABC-type nitrate/sulfonate/bicarbonate transport system substrate-binding protein
VKDLGSAQTLPLLAGGKVDVSFTGFGPSVVNSIVRGARLRVVAAREMISPSCGTASVVFLSGRVFPQGVSGMRQLKGHRIGVNDQSPRTTYWLDTLLRRDGMSLSDVDVRRMPESERAAALASGGIDAFVANDASLNSGMQRLGLVAGPSAASLLANSQFSFILFGRSLMDGDTATGARFLHAYFRGAGDFLRGRTPHYLDEFAAKNNLDADLLRRTCRATFSADGAIDLGDMRKYVQWMAAQKMCPDNVDAAALVDTRFLEAARALKLT